MTKPSTHRTLPALLTHALTAFSRDYERSEQQYLPSLVVWSNVLRLIDPDGVDFRTLPELSRMSQRAVRIATRDLERAGWLSVKPVPGVRGMKLVRLTRTGRAARDLGTARLEATVQDWNKHYGKSHIGMLSTLLQGLVEQFEVELPHYPTGYGQGDTSVTGGNYIPEDPGPPRIPAHGQEWPAVARKAEDTCATLPLPALLSQALLAFTIDYDADAESVFGGLGGAVTFFLFVSDAGIPLDDARRLGNVNGSGRSNLERHRLVVVDPAKRGKQRLVKLTARGRRVRDRYPSRIEEIEQRWREQYDAPLIDALRISLEGLDRRLPGDLPDYPDISAWLRRAPKARSPD